MRVSANQKPASTRLSAIEESLDGIASRMGEPPVVNVAVKVPEQSAPVVNFTTPEPKPEKLKLYEVTVTEWTAEGRIKKLRFEQKQ